MNAIIARPAAGATQAPKRKKAAPTPAPTAAQSNEATALLHQALRILNFVVTEVSEQQIPSAARAAALEADDVSYRMFHDQDGGDLLKIDAEPAMEFWDGIKQLETHLGQVQRLLGHAADDEIRCAIAAAPLVDFALDYIARLTDAVTVGTPSALRVLTTYAGARGLQNRPQPTIQRAPNADEIQMLADRAARANLVMDWCIKAQFILGHIERCADNDSEFLAALQQKDIRFLSADWQDCRMDEGLADVLDQQFLTIKQMAGGAA